MQAQWRAEGAYDATPGGMRDLQSRHDAALAEDPDGWQVRRFADRLLEGTRRREEEIAAYKAATGKAVEPEQDETPVGPAPEEGAPCDCVDYRFKKRCPHVLIDPAEVQADWVPTGQQASVRLHAAASELKTAKAAHAEAARTAKEAGWDGGDPEPDEVAKARRAMFGPALGFDSAFNAFVATPAGQAYCDRRQDEAMAATGYRTGKSEGFAELARKGAEDRAYMRAQFQERTGASVTDAQEEADRQSAPPDLMYGASSGCSCDRFRWTGVCAHTDPDEARLEMMEQAVSQAFAGSGLAKAMRKEGLLDKGPRKGLLARLRGAVRA
jgi:hypothetical protein